MPQCKPSVKAVIVKDGKFLTLNQNHKYRDSWGLPGGKVGYQEDPYETLHREIKEETNLEVEMIKPLGIYHFTQTKEPHHFIVVTVFLCKAISGTVDTQINNVTNEAILEHKWVTPKEFFELPGETDSPSLNKLIKSLTDDDMAL